MADTLYARVAKDLTNAIASGRYPVGSLLPTEMALCEQYCASRPTVRMALQELQGLGLVSRRKRVGTRVEAVAPQAGYSQSMASLDGLVLLAEHQVRVVKRIETVVLDRATAKQLGAQPGSRWLRIELLRLADSGSKDEPAGWTEAYVDAKYPEVPKLLRKTPKALISSLIESHYGRRVAEVEQTIRAVALPPELAEVLHAVPNSPALRIVRRYLDQANEPFEITVTLHPADRMVVTTKLRRDRP